MWVIPKRIKVGVARPVALIMIKIRIKIRIIIIIIAKAR